MILIGVIKESQRNWIGKSIGAMVSFPVMSAGIKKNNNSFSLEALELRGIQR
jgi:leucyl-tRNA synthetase